MPAVRAPRRSAGAPWRPIRQWCQVPAAPAAARSCWPSTVGRRAGLEHRDVVMLDETDRDAFTPAGAGDVELEEGVMRYQPAIPHGGVDGAAACDEVQPGGQPGLDGVAGQVDQEVVAPPRSGHDGDDTAGFEQRY